jgi:hypothetical protein
MRKLIVSSILLSVTLLNASVTVKQNRDANFGQVVQGDAKTLSIPSNCTTANADANLGKMQFDHSFLDSNSSVTVDWVTPSTLDDGSGNTITFTNSEAWCTDSTTGTTQDITDWASGTYTGQGTDNKYHNIYWGGSITVPIASPPGIYTGTINVTLTY